MSADTTRDDNVRDDAADAGDAATRVFYTPELLETILLDDALSSRQVFGAIRTCKAVGDTIRGSLKLQQKLWLREDPKLASPDDLFLNPLLQELDFSLEGFVGRHEKCALTLHDWDVIWSYTSRGEPWAGLQVVFEPPKENSNRQEVVTLRGDAQASWRRTLIAQKSPDNMETKTKRLSFGGDVSIVSNNTLGDLISTTMKYYESQWLETVMQRARFVEEDESDERYSALNVDEGILNDYTNRHPTAVHIGHTRGTHPEKVWAVNVSGSNGFRIIRSYDRSRKQDMTQNFGGFLRQDSVIVLNDSIASASGWSNCYVSDVAAFADLLYQRLEILRGSSSTEYEGAKQITMRGAEAATWQQAREQARRAAWEYERAQDIDPDTQRPETAPGKHYGLFSKAWLRGKREKFHQILDNAPAATIDQHLEVFRRNLEASIRQQSFEVERMSTWCRVLKNSLAERSYRSAKEALDGLHIILGYCVSEQLCPNY